MAALSLSGYRMYSDPNGSKPQWLEHLQYISVFAGALLIVQFTNANIFLTIAAFFLTGLYLYDRKFTAHKSNKDAAFMIGVSREMWLFVLVICLFRAFIYDYSLVPSGSMEPTLYAGDFLAVNKTAYQAKLPPFHTPLYQFSQPKIGDVIVFLSPEAPNTHYIKRVVAGPGDHVIYKDKTYIINGNVSEISTFTPNDDDNEWQVSATENLLGKNHAIQIDQLRYDRNEVDLIVPKGHYFVSGDNRDYSYDSRYFGPIHESFIVGKATHIITQLGYPIPLKFNRSGTIN
ncbi:signal peptidase I [Gammaproteobacteria bacterium]|nr:signal peptidase I [Gammaproteobacteria bacterium]